MTRPFTNSEGGRLARIKRQIQSQWDQSTNSSDAAIAKYETMKESTPSNPGSDEKDEDEGADSESADSASSSSTDFSRFVNIHFRTCYRVRKQESLIGTKDLGNTVETACKVTAYKVKSAIKLSFHSPNWSF